MAGCWARKIILVHFWLLLKNVFEAYSRFFTSVGFQSSPPPPLPPLFLPIDLGFLMILKICEGADKQLSIAEKLDDITDQWDHASFEFTPWKSRGVPVLKVSYTRQQH